MDNKATALKWYKQAKHDLELAGKNIAIHGYDISAFLSQQAVEKCLKALILLKGGQPPKIHYIDELARQLELSAEIMEDVFDLTEDYMFSRYPDIGDKVPYEEYTESTALEKVGRAKNIFRQLSTRLKPLEKLMEQSHDD